MLTLIRRSGETIILTTENEQVEVAPQVLSDLPTRASNALQSVGYSTIEEVIAGIKSGAIRPSKNRYSYIPNYGIRTHLDVCALLGIEVKETYPHRPLSVNIVRGELLDRDTLENISNEC